MLDGVALVTGAASGIGREIAFAFAKAGCTAVILADIDKEAAQATARECVKVVKNLSFKTMAVKVDITDEASVQSMVATVLNEFYRIDYSITALLDGAMLCTRAVAKAMAVQEPPSRVPGVKSHSHGKIINLGSANSYIAPASIIPYTVSKNDVIEITKEYAIDLSPYHIQVIDVNPSWGDTPEMMQESIKRIPQLKKMMKAVSQPERPALLPEMVAEHIIFLCSPGASYINGTGLIIGGCMPEK